MADTQEDINLPKFINPAWLKTKALTYREKYGHKILVFLFFVLISSIIWFFTALGKNYVTSISFPVKYDNFPADKILVNELPEELNIKIQSVGSTILNYKLSSGIRPVTFDVNSFLKGKPDKSTEFYILTSTAQDEIQNQFPTNIQVIDTDPDTIFFQLAKLVSKTVKIKPNLDISFKQQFMQKGDVYLNPDSVVVSGPRLIVDTIKYITTAKRELKNIDDTVNIDLELLVVPKLKYSIDEVQLAIYAEKYTEAEIVVPIQVENLPDSLEMKIFPKTATVKYNVGLSDFGKTHPDQFKISLDYTDAIQNLNRKINIALKDYPDYINNVSFYPKTVEFIIEK